MLGTSQTLNKGRYQIISSFGQDASSGMYEAIDTINNTPVILRESVGTSGKIATPSQIEAVNAAFTGEAMVLADIEHDCLVSVRDYFSEIDRQYLVLESLTGHNLTKYLEPDAERPAVREVLLWADQLLNGLQYLHRLTPPIIHANITPENLKLTSNLKIKLLTTKISSSSRASSNDSRQFTEDPAFAYRPLEDLWKDLNDVTQRVILNSFDENSANVLLRSLDARSDLYSAAASLYHVLTGVPPCDALERSIAILDGKPDPLQRPCDIEEEIAPEISDVFMRALSLRQENRFDSAMMMRQVLRTAVVRAQERAAGISQQPDAATVNTSTVITEDHPDLDLDRKTADDREREIEAEQAQLDEEQRRIEKRRLELEAEREQQAAERERLRQEAEAEQKRLIREKLELEAEQERQRIARRLADLEAERAKERAEEERLELEAQEEQRRAEEKLQALKLEQERHRAEQKRIELEAKKELELAEERIKELSFSGLKIEDLTQEDQAETQILDLSTTTDPETNPFDAEALGAKETQVPQFSEQPGINLRVPAIIGGVFTVLSIAVWGLMTITAPDTPAPVAQQHIVPVVEQPQVQISEQLPASVNEPSVSEQQAAAVDSSTSTLVPPPDVQPETTKRLQTAALQKKPVPEKTAPARKKVTVDDLINDN